MSRIGVIVIGRNEGARLERCLRSVVGQGAAVVYVDSGSTDGSIKVASTLGATAIELTTTRKFTAARARNAGFAALSPEVEFVQVVDGDCEVAAGWLATAVAALEADRDLAVVCGRRRERFPGASVYNQLCDMEWDTPIGPAKACGGDAMIRASAWQNAGGYDEDLIAGEEPEFCVRLRQSGWKIQRLDAEMTLHDAAMTRFSQWWRRNVRNGHAFAEGSATHGAAPEYHWVRETRSNWIWGLLLPAIALLTTWPTRGLSLLIAAALYTLQTFRVLRYGLRRGWGWRSATIYGLFVMLSKLPQAIGQFAYCLHMLRGSPTQLIEYKTAGIGHVQIDAMEDH